MSQYCLMLNADASLSLSLSSVLYHLHRYDYGWHCKVGSWLFVSFVYSLSFAWMATEQKNRLYDPLRVRHCRRKRKNRIWFGKMGRKKNIYILFIQFSCRSFLSTIIFRLTWYVLAKERRETNESVMSIVRSDGSIFAENFPFMWMCSSRVIISHWEHRCTRIAVGRFHSVRLAAACEL